MPPIAIAAGVAAVGTIGGALISSHAQSSAANQAAASQQQATNAQLQLGQQSLAQSRDIYNQNKAMLSPFVQRGNVAGESINALLGLPAPPPAAAATTPAPTTNHVTPTNTGVVPPHVGGLGNLIGKNIGLIGMRNLPNLDGPGATGTGLGSAPNGPASTGTNTGVVPPGTPNSTVPGTTPATPAPVNALSATDAFNNFANSAGMQFQLQQGEKAINQGYAANGTLQSGAALKALQSYGQNTALNNYFMPYIGLLSGQQNVGAQAGSAVAGVGSNFANTAAGINGQMAGYLQNGADAASNAALARGYAGAQLGSSIASGIGSIASSFIPTGSSGSGGFYGLSDERLKTKLVRLGDWDDRGDGLGKWEWNWKSDPNGERVTGVIAQEVERLRPAAYVPNFKGEYAGVNYAALGAL